MTNTNEDRSAFRISAIALTFRRFCSAEADRKGAEESFNDMDSGMRRTYVNYLSGRYAAEQSAKDAWLLAREDTSDVRFVLDVACHPDMGVVATLLLDLYVTIGA